jgi:hypothetical protein
MWLAGGEVRGEWLDAAAHGGGCCGVFPAQGALRTAQHASVVRQHIGQWKGGALARHASSARSRTSFRRLCTGGWCVQCVACGTVLPCVCRNVICDRPGRASQSTACWGVWVPRVKRASAIFDRWLAENREQ